MILSPLPQHQRKRKFHLFHGELIEEDDHGDSDDPEDDFDDEVPDEVPEEVEDESVEGEDALDAVPSGEAASS
jgi:hypothetical protein